MSIQNCINCLCYDPKTLQCAHACFQNDATTEELAKPNDCVRFESWASFLNERGWKPWYNDDYWVNPKCVTDNTRQDYTMHGMSMREAYQFELESKQPDPVPEYHFRGIAIR